MLSLLDVTIVPERQTVYDSQTAKGHTIVKVKYKNARRLYTMTPESTIVTITQ